MQEVTWVTFVETIMPFLDMRNRAYMDSWIALAVKAGLLLLAVHLMGSIRSWAIGMSSGEKKFEPLAAERGLYPLGGYSTKIAILLRS